MSQHTAITETIGEHKYEIFMLPPMVSHDLFMDVVKMIGPALGPVFDMFFGQIQKGHPAAEILDQEVGPEFFTKAAGSLFRDMDKTVFRRVIDALSGSTHVDGVPLTKIFDAHFLGKIDEMYRWLALGMRVQWGKSLSALVNAGRDAMTGAPASQSQLT